LALDTVEQAAALNHSRMQLLSLFNDILRSKISSLGSGLGCLS
jgi:hypothetical protein